MAQACAASCTASKDCQSGAVAQIQVADRIDAHSLMQSGREDIDSLRDRACQCPAIWLTDQQDRRK